jgi:hypothetical protein
MEFSNAQLAESVKNSSEQTKAARLKEYLAVLNKQAMNDLMLSTDHDRDMMIKSRIRAYSDILEVL